MPERPTSLELEKIMSMLKPLIEGLIASIKDDPTLAPEFRCPEDSSSRTFKISALLASRPRGSAFSEGKTISYTGGSQAMDVLDPGPEPRDKDWLFKFGIGIAILGLVLALFALYRSDPSGCGGVGLMLGGFGAAASAWNSDRDLEARHADWKKKRYEAETHWWCEACHTVFLPEQRHNESPEGTPKDENSPVESPDAAANVEPLRRQDSD